MTEKWHFLKGYINPHQKELKRGFIHYLLWQFGYYKDKELLEPIPEGFTFPNPLCQLDADQPQVMWVNHSSYWLRLAGKNFLVDPIWSSRCSPCSFIGPSRHHPTSLTLEELGRVDYVILSHNHYDHLDKKTVLLLHHLYPNITWIVPYKLKKWLIKTLPRLERGWVIELKWWEQFQSEEFTFTAVPAQHFSGRGLFDRNRTLWMGCVVESTRENKRFYFAGDTGYNPHDFKKIGERFVSMDLSLLPIGVYTPRKFMQPVHINPDEAVQIHQDVGSKLSIGGHWGTFKLSSDCITRPPYDLLCALEKKNCSWENFRVLCPGQKINW
ncbi:MAG: MBL fold metallo-hydrolase [Verrucomicrobia bacterium]|nr:MBL fold metallo-hydrolase [Verrucomicrobiota bacterium]MBS0646880.1 MBL fold metallo-hydrolase [Verrucomicrobiota bacterium]